MTEPITPDKMSLFKLSSITLLSLLVLLAITLSLAYKIDPRVTINNFFNDNNDDCIFHSDFYIVRFSAYYDPGKSIANTDYFDKFCHKIPDTGPTVIVIDLLDDDARDLPVKIKFVQLGEDLAKGKYKSVIHQSEHKKLSTGFIKSKINFLYEGEYAALIEIGQQNSLDYDVVTIPFKINSI